MVGLKKIPLFQDLQNDARQMKTPSFHLKELWKEKDRQTQLLYTAIGLQLDIARQRITPKILKKLIKLAIETGAVEKLSKMAMGQLVNVSENRPALHMADRATTKTIKIDNENISTQSIEVRKKIAQFTQDVHTGNACGTTGKKFQHIVVVGIGGSHLGAAFLYDALLDYAKPNMTLHFLSNIDPHNFLRISRKIDLETTLWVFISKSFTTTESIFNIWQAIDAMEKKGLVPKDHIVTVSSKTKDPNIPPIPAREAFLFHAGIGGRFSATSAAGLVPLSLVLGTDVCDEILMGAHEMDEHVLSSPPAQNLPLLGAVINVWNNCFLNYTVCAVIPYAEALSLLPFHLQQVSMESCGKRVDEAGNVLKLPSGMILFGAPGTGAQHSFFQMAHQGRPFPIDFIGVLNPKQTSSSISREKIRADQILFSNLLAQANALAFGKTSENSQTTFDGNRPSTIITITDLSPKNMGRLLSYYEAQTVLEGFILGINPFDQFGVELGKTMANSLYAEFVAMNTSENPLDIAQKTNEEIRHYLLEMYIQKLF